MQKNSITNKITPCCGLPFSVMYWFIQNLTLNTQSDREFIMSKLNQNGTISKEGWIVLINSATLESDSSMTKVQFLEMINCKGQPNCNELKLLIEGLKIGNWTPETELPLNIATVDEIANGQTLIGNTYTKEQTDDKISNAELSGIVGVATTSTVPSVTGFKRWLVHTVGTYTNFSGIVVTAEDLDIVNGVANNEVVLEVNNGVATKRVRRLKGDAGSVPLVQIKGASTTSVMSQKAVTDEINGIYNGVTTLTPDTSIPFNLTAYYRNFTPGAISGTANGHNRTDKFLLKKGDKLEYGVNTYTMNGGSGLINFYNLDDSFKLNYLTTNAGNINSFVQGEYTATEDVIVGMSNYVDGNHGTAYATIVHVAPQNLNKGLTFLLEEDSVKESRLDALELRDIESLQMYLRGNRKLNKSVTKKYGIIVAGQSNTEGRVPIAEAPSYITSNSNTVSDVQMWNNGTKAFAPFKFSTNTGSGTGTTTSNLYAYDAIASYLLAQNKSKTIYLIKRAVGGTAIDINGTNGGGYWTPKTEEITTGLQLIEELKTRVEDALSSDSTLEIKAVLWHQGEGDSTTLASEKYYQNLKDVIAYIRGIVGNPKLPFVFGTIATISAQYKAKVDGAMRKIDTEDAFVYLCDMKDGTLLDSYHFDATSTNLLGSKMFDFLKTF